MQYRIMWAFRDFVIAILTMLSFLLPFSSLLLPYQQEVNNSPDKYMPVIEQAIRTENVADLESLMCLNIRKNEKELTQKIETVYNSIHGEIKDFQWEKGFQSSGNTNGYGGRIEQQDINATITTTQSTYHLAIVWETVNNYQPDETKIRAFSLMDETYQNIVLIAATNGIHSWPE